MASPSSSPARLVRPRRDDRPLRRTGGDTVLVIALVLLIGFGGMVLARWYRQGFSLGAAGPMTQGASLWQRQWTESVRAAVQRFATEDSPLTGLTVCVAEIAPAAPEGGGTTIVRAGDVDWALLAGLGRPVSLAVRVRTSPGEIQPDQEPATSLRRLVDEIFAKSAAAGLKPSEIQVDFPCPTTQLRGYAGVLAALRAAHPGVPFCPTVDPAWLASEEFAPLARAAGGFILQPHQWERIGADRRPPTTLCDPVETVNVVRQAARVGVPFRVSLPTYGYRLVLDAEDRLVSATAEGPRLERQRPPPGGHERLLLADAGEMARLVRGWNEARPTALRGVLWDRLPVEGERLNWPWPALRAVAAGRVPRPKIRWELSLPGESEQRELALRNEGEADAILPPTLAVSCPAEPLAVEAINGYEVVPPTPKDRRPPTSLLFRRRAEDNADTVRGRLSPGNTLAVGRVRLPEDVPAPPLGEDEISADMETPPLEAPSPAATP